MDFKVVSREDDRIGEEKIKETAISLPNPLGFFEINFRISFFCIVCNIIFTKISVSFVLVEGKTEYETYPRILTF